MKGDRAATTGRLSYFFLFACVSSALLAAFRIDKHLSADGVHYFATILDGQDFCRVDWSRRFAEYVIQWPLVLAVRAGVTGIPALGAVFAAGIYLPYLLSFALCVFAVRRENPSVLSLPILAMACVNLPSDYILAGEHHVMVLLASPILLLILRRAPPTWWDGLFLGLALLAFTRTYPAALVPALLYSVLLSIRLAFDREDSRALVIRAVALLLALSAIAVNVHAVLNPRDPANGAFFRQWLPMVLHFPGTLYPAAFAALFLLGLASRGRYWPLLPVLPFVLYVPYALGAPHGLTAAESFGARTLSVTVLPLLLLLGVAVQLREPTLAGLRKVLLVGMVLAVVIGSIRLTSDWNQFRGDMTSVLATERGFVPIEATDLDANPCRWGWTSPQLSVVWSAPVVRAIVLNRAREPWVPFDPRHRLILKRFVRYDPVFADVDPTAAFAPAPK